MADVSLIGMTLDGKYKLIRLLGEGGMGSVYQAEQEGRSEPVAIKVINSRLLGPKSDGVHRFRREARAATAVDSEHIVQVLDSGTDEATGLLYLVMECLEGEDLQHLLDRTGPLVPDAALRIIAQALLGLQKAHEARIVHRDIKPANLFLRRRKDGEITVKLLDFGIAKIKADPLGPQQTTGITTTGGFLGSPLYMSPEQVQSSRDVDHRTDIWSLGSALYCTLAGQAPHGHVESLGKLIYTIIGSPPPPLRKAAPWVSPEIAKMVHGALGFTPEERYSSAVAMLEALRPLLPEGFALREEMLVPVPEEQRGTASNPLSHPPSRAALWTMEFGPTSPIRGDKSTDKAGATTVPVSETAPALDTTVPVGDLDAPPSENKAPSDMTTSPVGDLDAPPSENTAPSDTTTSGTEKPLSNRKGETPPPAPRARRPALAGAILAVVIGSIWVIQSRSRPAPVPMPASTPAPMEGTSVSPPQAEPPPSPSLSAAPSAAPALSASALPSRRVTLVVFPSDASVEVDGAKVSVLDGVVEIAGTVGSEHRIRVFKAGMKEMPETTVRVTDAGASPAKVELSPLASANPRPPRPGAGGAKPPPALPAKATTATPPPKPTSSDDELAP